LLSVLLPVSQNVSTWEEEPLHQSFAEVLPEDEEKPRHVVHDINPCPGFPVNGTVQGMYPSSICIATSMQQYRPLNYPIPMYSGTHLVSPTPSYYIGSIAGGMGVNHPATYGQSPLLSCQPYTYMKKKHVRGKHMGRKELPSRNTIEGYPNMVYPPGLVATCFPGSMVQAATGVPIVMHQTMPSYMAPGNMHAPAINQELIYPVPNAVPDIQQHHTISPPVVEIKANVEELVEQVKSEDLPAETIIDPPAEIGIKEEPVLLAPVVEEKAVEKTPSLPTPSEPEPAVADEASIPSKSWASLFKKEVEAAASEKPTARVEPFTSLGDVKTQVVKPAELPKVDVVTQRLAKHLSVYEPPFTPLALLPRGLINKSNWCYINATLQALAACPLFVHLMKSLVPLVGGYSKDESNTPIINSMVEFFDQFDTVPVRSHKDRAAAKKEDPYFGTSFEPSFVYKMLSKTRSDTFKVEGRQEDAEEFLSCLLNGLHDEMIEILKITDRETASSTADKTNVKPSSLDDEDWQVIGPKNRGCVTHTTTYSKTPVSNLFLGLMRSALLYSGAQSTATLQPFFSLQLDIQSDKVYSVRDALSCLVSKEPLTGYVSSKTGQEVEASRQSTLEELPLILILHLKCFVYDKSGGCQKLLKHIDFSSDLDISKDLLSPNQKNKYNVRQRQYKLFAVVYHDGKEANKGHYVTEVHHTGMGSWLRYDDSVVNRVSDSLLFKYSLPRMPYLLLYRRADTCSVINPRVQSNQST